MVAHHISLRWLRLPLAFLFLVPVLFAKKERIEPTPVFADVTARGRMLYECDQANWHASDAVQALNPPLELVGRYIARKTGSVWTVGFGRLNEARDKFLVAYEATQGTTLNNFTVKKIDPPQGDISFYLFAARALDTALRDFRGEKRPYNAAVLPTTDDQLYVYVMPAQTKDDVYPLGGDVRYLISPDGNTIVEKRQLHKTILENQADSSKGTTHVAGFHTHVLSDVPEDTDVFHVLTQNPPLPEYVGTMSKKLYIINADGTILQGKL